MLDNAHVSDLSIIWMIVGAAIFIIVPIVLAIVWKVKKKEPVTTILIGAGTFLVFAIVIEKMIQNALFFPTYMGLPDTALSSFCNARPVLMAFIAGLFPGLFEETGRLVAFKTLLRKRTNRETSLSYGIGHGGFEVVFILGIAFVEYIIYALMINSGAFQTVLDQVAEKAPEQLSAIESIITVLTTFSFGTLCINVVERIFAVMFHIGASVLVFYACKEKSKFWLYPLAIALHTAVDFIAGLCIFNVINLSDVALEAIVAAFGLATFFVPYFLLYKKDTCDSRDPHEKADLTDVA